MVEQKRHLLQEVALRYEVLAFTKEAMTKGNWDLEQAKVEMAQHLSSLKEISADRDETYAYQDRLMFEKAWVEWDPKPENSDRGLQQV